MAMHINSFIGSIIGCSLLVLVSLIRRARGEIVHFSKHYNGDFSGQDSNLDSG